jgi:hypothetical protein
MRHVMKLKGMALLAAGSVALGAAAGIAGVALTGSSALGTVVHYKVVERTFIVRSGHERVFDVKCPRGYLPVGGGGHTRIGPRSEPQGLGRDRLRVLVIGELLVHRRRRLR